MFDLLTTGGALWYETLPFVVAFATVAIELVVRILRNRRPILDLMALGQMFSEGISICIAPIYGFTLIFNPKLAAQIADKNSKIIAWAMFYTFAALLVHLSTRWFSNNNSHW